jgi:hypothetical protein
MVSLDVPRTLPYVLSRYSMMYFAGSVGMGPGAKALGRIVGRLWAVRQDCPLFFKEDIRGMKAVIRFFMGGPQQVRDKEFYAEGAAALSVGPRQLGCACNRRHSEDYKINGEDRGKKEVLLF